MGLPPNFRPMFIVAKRLDGSRCHLVWRWASTYATLYSMRPQLPPEKGHIHSHPIFGLCLLWPNGWMDEDAACYGSRPRFRPHCTRRGPSSRERGTAPPLLFGPCLLWPRSPTSATAELLWAIWPSLTTVRETVIPPATATINCCMDVHCVSTRTHQEMR